MIYAIAMIAIERGKVMLELCGTAIVISIVCCLTRLLVKSMELSYLDKKNEKEGKYVN